MIHEAVYSHHQECSMLAAQQGKMLISVMFEIISMCQVMPLIFKVQSNMVGLKIILVVDKKLHPTEKGEVHAIVSADSLYDRILARLLSTFPFENLRGL
jgi:hypothetical protein